MVAAVRKGGTRCIIHRGYRYREQRVRTADGNISWRCTKRNCSATFQTGPEIAGFAGGTGANGRVDGHNHDAVGNIDDRLKVIGPSVGGRGRRPETIRVADGFPAAASAPKAALTADDGADARPALLCHMDASTRIVVFATAEFLAHLAVADAVSADGCSWPTACPAGYERMYAVHVRCGREHVQAAFCLLPACSADAYATAWRLLRAMCPGGRLEPAVGALDLDAAARAGFALAFPRARVTVHRYHVAQAWHTLIVALCLEEDYHQGAVAVSAAAQRAPPPPPPPGRPHAPCRTVGEWLTRFFGLTMLPAGRVPDAFRRLVDAAPTGVTGRTVAAARFAHCVRACYVHEAGPCPPRLWAERPSGAGDDGPLDAPRWHWRRMRHTFRGPGRPSLDKVAMALHAHQAAAWSATRTAARYGGCWKKKMASHSAVVARHNAQAWRALSEDRLSVVDYLQTVAYLYRA